MGNKANNAHEADDYQFRCVMLLLAGVAACGLATKAKWFYFQYYEPIYECLIALAAAFIAGTVYFIKKKTKHWADRVTLLNEARERNGSIYVGETDDGMALCVSETDRKGHVQIIGSTGRGKTESVIIPWLARDIYNGCSAILVCGKGDAGLAESIKSLVTATSLKARVSVFDLGNPEVSCSTNPLEYGSPQQVTDRLFTAFNFEDPYYKSVQLDVVSSVLRLVREEGSVTFKRLYELLGNDDALKEAISKSEDLSPKRALTDWLYRPRQQREEKLSGIMSQLGPFAIGEIAHLVNGPKEGAPHVTISEILLPRDQEQHVLIVLIPTLKYQELGHQLGKLLFQELGWAIGERASRVGEKAPFTPVYLDEFSAFVYPRFVQILNKARSSNVPLHLSHQSMGDLGIVSPEFSSVVTTNTNVKCILGLNDPETADWMARHLGTRTEEKLTEQAEEDRFLMSRRKTGSLSIREVEAYKIHPNRLKNYMNGRGVLHFPTALGNITEEIQFEPIPWSKIFRKEQN